MRMSQLLTTTLREAPRDSEGGNQELLTRGGYIRLLASGIYSFLPLGTRVIAKLTEIIRKEMSRSGGQEVLMPVLQPEEIWRMKPNDGGPSRVESVPILFRLQDRREHAFVIGPTHEEVATLLAREFVRSYRDLPQRLYQIGVKFRDEPRPRGGLLRTREFVMNDLYSFDGDEEGLEQSYQVMGEAYRRIFERCGLRFLAVEADSGAIGGKDSQEFLALTEAGEDVAMVCDHCGYAANVEKAEFVRTVLPEEPELEIEEVYTPDCKTIEQLAAFLHIPASKTMKAVCYTTGDTLVLVSIRGDLEVNEVKLTSVLRSRGIHAFDLHMATPDELQRAGIVAGFTSPVNKGENVLIVLDTSLSEGRNFVGGANRIDYHFININYPRDFRVDMWGDIAEAYEGAQCVRCGGTLHNVRGSESGHIFKVGSLYSTMFGATFLDIDGKECPLLMGCYGIGVGRLLATIVEQHHDEKGICWPFAVAPYQVALLGLDLEKGENGAIAERLYADLVAAGIEVLFDDRVETAGVKFNDADLLGLPLRVVVSKRSLKQGGVEIKLRTSREGQVVALEEAVERIRQEIEQGIA
jgi:prolyl-tRNA synthetase